MRGTVSVIAVSGPVPIACPFFLERQHVCIELPGARARPGHHARHGQELVRGNQRASDAVPVLVWQSINGNPHRPSAARARRTFERRPPENLDSRRTCGMRLTREPPAASPLPHSTSAHTCAASVRTVQHSPRIHVPTDPARRRAPRITSPNPRRVTRSATDPRRPRSDRDTSHVREEHHARVGLHQSTESRREPLADACRYALADSTSPVVAAAGAPSLRAVRVPRAGTIARFEPGIIKVHAARRRVIEATRLGRRRWPVTRPRSPGLPHLDRYLTWACGDAILCGRGARSRRPRPARIETKTASASGPSSSHGR